MAADFKTTFGGDPYISAEVALSASSLSVEVVSEIISWASKIRKIGTISVEECKANVGPFLGVFPVNVDIQGAVDSMSGEVTFSVDYVNSDWSKSWKSWFIIEE